jgi:hypothetical protein
MKRIIKYMKSWWSRHIVSDCPPYLDDHEFSDKYRK